MSESVQRHVLQPMQTHQVVVVSSSSPSPMMPVHSSTLNESLMRDVQSWHITSLSPLTASASDFFRAHQEHMQRTPPKAGAFSSAKLGSPERNELMSGRMPHGATATSRLFTPKPERSSPAKKRLFALHQVAPHGVTRKSLLAQHRKHDPVMQFMVRRSLHHIVERIFSELGPADLHHCRRVATLWCAAVDAFPALRRAAAAFELALGANKENPAKLRALRRLPLVDGAGGRLSSNSYASSPSPSRSKDSAYGSYEDASSALSASPPPPPMRRSLGDCNSAAPAKRVQRAHVPQVPSTPPWFACRGTALTPRSPDRPTLAEECRGAGTLTSRKRLRRLCR